MSTGERFRDYPVFTRRFSIRGRDYEILGPANFDELLDDPQVQARFYANQEEFLPYWAEFWPASLILAHAVAAWEPIPADEPSPKVLELGAGLGLIGVIVAALGYDVICSDYDDDCIAFIKENARRNGVSGLTAEFIDWRETYDLRFDRIIGAEITYEARNFAPIAEFIYKHLQPDGFALIVDRNRQIADAFPEIVRHNGLKIETSPAQCRDAEGKLIEARFFRIEHAARRRGAPHM